MVWQIIAKLKVNIKHDVFYNKLMFDEARMRHWFRLLAVPYVWFGVKPFPKSMSMGCVILQPLLGNYLGTLHIDKSLQRIWREVIRRWNPHLQMCCSDLTYSVGSLWRWGNNLELETVLALTIRWKTVELIIILDATMPMSLECYT